MDSPNAPATPALLFVYGTLMQAIGHPQLAVLRRYGQPLGPATCPGQLVLPGYYPALLPSTNPAARVRGEVWLLHRAADAFSLLDAYEEYDPANPQGSVYRREWRTVQLTSGRQLQAWVYCYNQPAETLPVLPSGDFLAWAKAQGWVGEPAAEPPRPAGYRRRQARRMRRAETPAPAWTPLGRRPRRPPGA